jgi:hypothetical protein
MPAKQASSKDRTIRFFRAANKAKRFRSPNGYTTVDKAAKKTGTTALQMQRLVQTGGIDGINQENRWFVSLDALRSWKKRPKHYLNLVSNAPETVTTVTGAEAQEAGTVTIRGNVEASADVTIVSLPIPRAEYDQFARTISAVYHYRGQTRSAEEHLAEVIKKHTQEFQSLSQLVELSPGIGNLAS